MADTVDDWVQRWVELGADAFAAAHPYPFLLQHDKRKTSASGQFRTLADSASERVQGNRLALPLHALVKVAANAFAMMITVGRAPNNDVVLASDSASKFHAYFQDQDGEWLLRDAGSSNGTFLAGVRLAPREPSPIPDSAEIGFGRVRCTFFPPAHARSMLAFEAKMKERQRR
jgi:hypothetical protein